MITFIDVQIDAIKVSGNICSRHTSSHLKTLIVITIQVSNGKKSFAVLVPGSGGLNPWPRRRIIGRLFLMSLKKFSGFCSPFRLKPCIYLFGEWRCCLVGKKVTSKTKRSVVEIHIYWFHIFLSIKFFYVWKWKNRVSSYWPFLL